MKRYGNLYDRVCDRSNLDAAEQEARAGKARKAPVRRFLARREELLDRLHESLVAGTYTPSPCPHRKVYEPKERNITIPRYYPNLITDHAVARVCLPIWTRSLPYNVYSNVKGRGIEACRKRVRAIIDTYRGEKRLYCLKTDIAKFYPSCPHRTLKAAARWKIKDARLLSVLDAIIDAGGENGRGLPIGSHLSQHLANLVIARLVHAVNATGLECACYADDIAVLSPDKDALHRCLHEVIVPFVRELGMEVKGDWQVFPLSEGRHSTGRGLDFCGYVFFRGCTSLRKRIKLSFERAARKVAALGLEGKAYARALAPWLGWLEHSDCWRLTNEYISDTYTLKRYERTINRGSLRASA